MKIRLFLPRIYFLSALLYSLLFLGIYIPQFAVICVIATVPFTGIAWMVGMAAVQAFGTESVYPMAAWIAVFMQAYCVATIVWKIRERKSSTSLMSVR